MQANGATLRRGTGGSLVNGVLARWPGIGLNVREAITDSLRQRDSLYVASVLLTQNTTGNFDPVGSANFGLKALYPLAIDGIASTTTLFNALPAVNTTPTIATIDWTPAAGSALRAGGLTTFPTRLAARTTPAFFAGTLTGTAYLGAADVTGTKWWQGWTAYARN